MADPYHDRDPILSELAAIRQEIRDLREEIAKRPVPNGCIPKRGFFWPHREIPQPHNYREYPVEDGKVGGVVGVLLACVRCGKTATVGKTED